MAQFFDYFNECSLRIFSCWNVQMILNVSCKSGHVRLNCLRTFRNCQSKFKPQNLTNWSIPLTNWSIPLTTLSISTSTSNFNNFVSWYAGGRGNTTQTSEAVRSDCAFHFLKSNQINTSFDKASPQGKGKISQ